MKVFVDKITVTDEDLMRDIVHALESCPQSGRSYEVRMVERRDNDPIKNRASNRGEWELSIGRHEIV